MASYGPGNGWLPRRPLSPVMEQNGGAHRPGEAAAADVRDRRAANSQPPSIAGELSGALVSARGVLSNMQGLLSLGARSAGLTLMWITGWTAFAAVLAVTAWLGLMGAVVLWAVSTGVTWMAAIASIAAVNLLAAAFIILICLRMSRELLFPDTRRLHAAKPSRLPGRLH